MQTGLYVVGTPIGNLSDMSPRAIDVLQNVDLIAAEDTRVFGKLAAHFDIKTKRVSCHEHNERDVVGDLIQKIQNGMSVACVSDAGMPGISDPGFRLVRAARAAGVPVFVVPGPVACISALVLSGFPTDRFTFCGFFDEKKLRDDNKIPHTIIYYESPNRVMATIAAMARVMPERKIAIAIAGGLNNAYNVWDYDVEKYRRVGDFDLTDEQIQMLYNVCNNNICILNGFAGSGKSASTQALINMLEDKHIFSIFR